MTINRVQCKGNILKRYAGNRKVNVTDEAKGISFPVFVMYPTTTPSKVVRLGPFQIQSTPEASIEDGKFQLVVISHGGGGNNLAYLTIAQYFVKHGFIVAMPEHYKNNRNNNDLEGTNENLEYRPRHISLVIDTIYSDSQLRDHVQQNIVAIVGHSMGGYTALALAGGEPWSQDREKIFVTPDSRIKAVVLLAPATAFFTPKGSLDNVTVPILLLAAEKDQITPKEHSELVLNQVLDKTMVHFEIIENAGHFSFLSPFPKSMRSPKFLPSTDPKGFDRESFHSSLNKKILTFLRGAIG